jgi:hypothetical protein
LRLLELHLIAALTKAAHGAMVHAHIRVIEALTEGVWLEALLLLLLLSHTSKRLRACLTKATSSAHLWLLLSHHIITLHATVRIGLVIHREVLHAAEHGLERLFLLLLLLLLWLRLSKSLHQAALPLHIICRHNAVECRVLVVG